VKLPPPPSAAADPAQIKAYEQTRGSDDWTGAQGQSDAWQMHTDFWNTSIYSLMGGFETVSTELGKLG